MSVHTVLLADESTTTRRIVELSFTEPDVNVVAVVDGEEALARIASEPPDIVLADIALPKRSGYDVAAYVAARPELSHIPVVLLAGALDTIDEAAVRRSGCRSVIRKPFDPKQLSTRVRNLLTGGADLDLDQCLDQIDEAFRDLNAVRVDQAAAPVPVSENMSGEDTSTIVVDASSVPTLQELLGEIDRTTEVFSLDTLPADDRIAGTASPVEEPITEAAAGAVAPVDAVDPLAMDALVELVTDRVMKRLTEQLRLAADAVAAHLVAAEATPIIREEILKLRQEP